MARDDDQDAPAPWHNSTAKVLGASVAAVAAIGLIVGAIVFVTQQADEPTQAPLNFVDPTFSATSGTPSPTASSSAHATTTGGRPLNPQTTDIDLPPPSETPPTTPSSSPPSTSRRLPSTKEDVPEERTDEDEDEPTTTRRPRFNETRTLYPVP